MVDIQNIQALWKNRNVKRGLIFVGVLLVAYLWTAAWLNKLHLTEQKIGQFWTILKENCERRVDILPQFVQLIQDNAPQAEHVLESLRKSYIASKQLDTSQRVLNSSKSAAAFSAAQQQISDSLFLMQKEAIAIPTIAHHNQYAMLVAYLKTLDQQIEFSTKALEQQINYYNFQISTFPQNIVNIIYPRYKPKFKVSIEPSIQNIENPVQDRL